MTHSSRITELLLTRKEAHMSDTTTAPDGSTEIPKVKSGWPEDQVPAADPAPEPQEVAAEPVAPTPATTAEERQKRLNKAYSAASKKLRETYQGEFNLLYQQEAQNLGESWTPKPTAEEQAALELAKILEAHPQLRSQV